MFHFLAEGQEVSTYLHKETLALNYYAENTMQYSGIILHGYNLLLQVYKANGIAVINKHHQIKVEGLIPFTYTVYNWLAITYKC